MAEETSTRKKTDLPLVYSCSGCSSAAQMANFLAVRLDRLGLAQMSCIAGVGGDVPSLVKTATSGREIVAIDGCPLHCVSACLGRHDTKPSVHFDLNTLKVKKVVGMDFDPAQAEEVLQQIIPLIPVAQADDATERELQGATA